ncbi:4-hydroxybenzoate polyprenyl transferase [Spinellus fusiger]|nr:4-hydroxybenzoate polyprenyl transferase [Spinellus fusiger]
MYPISTYFMKLALRPELGSRVFIRNITRSHLLKQSFSLNRSAIPLRARAFGQNVKIQPLSRSTHQTSLPDASDEKKAKRQLYDNWVDRLPEKVSPYLYLLRLDRPVGSWLLFWPCAWSITMAAASSSASISQTASMLALFGLGAVTMRGAGCVINDFWDRDLDSKVERTKTRPIASGAISPTNAILFLGSQMTIGLGILTQLNTFSIFLGASCVPMSMLYPLLKRYTYWPQLGLGVSYNWGALLGWSAMTGELNLSVAGPLYLGSVAWTIVYDTIYAHQDKKDDVNIGVKSTALLFGNDTNKWLTGFSTMFVSMTALAGYMNGQGLPFYLLSVGGTAAHLAWQLRTVNYEMPSECWSKFKSNVHLGGILWSGLAADALLAHPYALS